VNAPRCAAPRREQSAAPGASYASDVILRRYTAFPLILNEPTLHLNALNSHHRFLYYVLVPLRYGITVRHAIIPSGSSSRLCIPLKPLLPSTTHASHTHTSPFLILEPHFPFPRVYLLMKLLHFLHQFRSAQFRSAIYL